MSSSSIQLPVFQAKIGNVQNQADSTSVYSAGQWSFKNSTAVTSVTITDAGDARIGTTSNLGAADRLTVVGGNVAVQRTAGIITALGDNTQQGYVGTLSNHPFIFYSNAAPRMTLDASGNVGIGTTDPGAKLDVQGDVLLPFNKKIYGNAVSGGNKSFIELYNGSNGNLNIGTNFPTAAITFSTGESDTERMRIDAFGSLCLTGAVNGYAVTGGIYAPNVYNFTTASAANMFIESGGFFRRSTSSIKYKTDVQDNPHGLAEVMALRPVTYKGKNDGNIVFGGLIAEEVHAAGLTEFVQYADDGSPDALAYGQMVSLAFKAIQEQQAMIESMKAEIEALKAKP